MEQYLYEIMEDYKNTESDTEKENIFKEFCTSLWSCENKRRTCTKTIRFYIRKDLQSTETGQVFNTWSEIEYKGYKSMSKETDWCSLIRQKINNLYTRHFDKEVILNRDYMDLLHTPKRLYHQWIDGMEMDVDELTAMIDDAINEAEILKASYQKAKMQLSWADYKMLTEKFLDRIFQSCKLIDTFENGAPETIYSFINEDNFYIRYFCKSLEYHMKNYTKEYYGLKRGRNRQYVRCRLCQKLIEKTNNRIIYCKDCSTKVHNAAAKERMRRHRQKCYHLENRQEA